MSANTRRRRRSSNICLATLQQEQKQQLHLPPPTAQLSLPATDVGSAADDEMDIDIEMPRICRCCCKRDLELFHLFEAKTGSSSNSHSSSTTTNSAEATTSTAAATVAAATTHKRNIDNPIDYALSGSHSGMDIVLEEMIIWMLNISRDDGLPQEICRQCKAQFLMVAKFRRRCVRMQQRLQDYAQELSDRQEARLNKRQQKRKREEDQQEAKQQQSHSTHLSKAQKEEETQTQTEQPQPKEVKTEVETELPPPKIRRLMLRLRKLHRSTIDQMEDEDKEQQEDRVSPEDTSASSTPSGEVYEKINIPWKTKAARKQLSEIHSDASSQTEVEDPSCVSTSSEVSVGPCYGFESDSNPSSSTSTSTSSTLKFPKRPQARIVAGSRRGRRFRNAPTYPRQRRNLMVKKMVSEPAEEPTSIEKHKDKELPDEKKEQTEPKSEEHQQPPAVGINNEKSNVNSETEEVILPNQDAAEPEPNRQLQSDEISISNGIKEVAEKENITTENEDNAMANVAEIEKALEADPSKESESCVTSSTSSNGQPGADPIEQTDANQSELIVSIPLEKLTEDLQRKLSTDKLEKEQPSNETKSTSSDPKEDKNNNAKNENFCQSATADSFNSAVALSKTYIEANSEQMVTDPFQVAETPPPPPPPPNPSSFPPSPSLASSPLGLEKSELDEPQILRTAPTPMDFLAEFEKHCEMRVRTPSPTSSPPATEGAVTALNDLSAKEQLEVEMNDVETTLNGILNEMQDQHIYPPTCPHIDEFLTPADYAPLNEQEDEESVSPLAVPPKGNEADENTTNAAGHTTSANGGNLFDSNNFPNELIGFQNDIPCFETIESTPESQQKLQMELTQLLNDLQPADPIATSAPVAVPVPTPVPGEVVQDANYEQLIQTPMEVMPQWSHLQQQQQQQILHQQMQQASQTQLQWSAVGGLEAIKTTPIESNGTTATTTYYIQASDLYGPPSVVPHVPVESYAMLDSNENYLLEQQANLQQQQQQQQQHQQQPIMILIQQQEMQQPVASASNPQQPPLHLYGAPINNEMHQLNHQQQQQQQQQQQHQQQLQQQQQQVQNHTVLATNPPSSPNDAAAAAAAAASAAAAPMPATTPMGRALSLKCRFCQNGPRFLNSLEYSRHIIELHPAVAPFNCPHCPLAFAGRSKRSQHILSNHVVQQFQCGQCTQVFPAQRALDLHIQRFHMPLPPAAHLGLGAVGGGVRVEDVHLQINEPALQIQANTTTVMSRKGRIICCPDCDDCSAGHHHGIGGGPPGAAGSFEELSNIQPPPMVLTPPATIASMPSPQPMSTTPHITMPSPEQSEPDSTTTLRQFRKRNCMTATPIASPSPSSSPSSSTMIDSNPPPLVAVSNHSNSNTSTPASLQVSELRASHQCIYCEERFTNDIALRKHHQLAHGAQTTMPFVCTICKRGYRMRTALNRHMESHDAEGRPYECNLCRVRFPRPSQLTLHKITVHLLSKPHTCDECGKQFGTESALKTHIKFHGELGYQCDECDQRFVYIAELRKHRRTHNGKLFYKCEYCPRSFLHFTVYRAHMNSHLPLGVFLNEDNTALMSSSSSSSSSNNRIKLENHNSPLTIMEESKLAVDKTLPATSMQQQQQQLMMVESSNNNNSNNVATNLPLETIATTP